MPELAVICAPSATVPDPIVGPVVLFGAGGKAVEVVADRSVALPPLTMKLAKELVAETRATRLLEGYRDEPAVDREMAFVAIGGEGDTFGVMRSVTDPDNEDAQSAIVIRSDVQGRRARHCVDEEDHRLHAPARYERIVGEILHNNQRMRNLARNLAFVANPEPCPYAVRVALDLTV